MRYMDLIFCQQPDIIFSDADAVRRDELLLGQAGLKEVLHGSHAIGFPVEAGDDILCRMTFPFSFTPVLQYDKIGTGIRQFAASHHRETVYSHIGFDFRISVQYLVDFLADGFGAWQARSRWQLAGDNEISVVFFRDEGRRPAHEHDGCRS